MKELTDAIVAKFNATPALVAAFAGGIWASEAPEGTDPATQPYVVYEVLSAPREESYGDAAYEAVVSFACYGRGLAATLANAKVLTDAFDGATLALSGAVNVGTWRNDEPRTVLQPQDADQADVWAAFTQYRFGVN